MFSVRNFLPSGPCIPTYCNSDNNSYSCFVSTRKQSLNLLNDNHILDRLGVEDPTSCTKININQSGSNFYQILGH